MKIIGNIILVLFIIVASAYAGRNILIKNAVNSGGSTILGTNVNVDSVNFSPFSGDFHIQGLSIANPNGFSAGNALYLGEVSIKIDAKSFLSKTVMVEEIRITNPEINILGKPGDTNLTRLQKNIASKAPASTTKDTTTASSDDHHAEHKCKEIQIRYFTLQEGKVTAAFEGLGETAAIKLPTIELHNLGKGSDLNVHQSIQMIFTEIMKVAQKTALSGAGFSGQLENLKTDFQEKQKDLKNKLKGFGF